MILDFEFSSTVIFFGCQYYAKTGLRTCLLIHSQDPTVEHLIGCKIGNSPTLCNDNLSVVRLETTKVFQSSFLLFLMLLDLDSGTWIARD